MPSSDIIRFPRNYTAYIVGSATAGWKQEVNIKVQNLGGSDEQQFIFEATNQPMVVTSGGTGFMKQEAIVIEADDAVERQIEFDFKVFRIGAIVPSNIKGFNRDAHSPLSWVTTYTYSTEDGGDNDYHDTTLIVSLIKDIK